MMTRHGSRLAGADARDADLTADSAALRARIAGAGFQKLSDKRPRSAAYASRASRARENRQYSAQQCQSY
jgi:hypothetical protein